MFPYFVSAVLKPQPLVPFAYPTVFRRKEEKAPIPRNENTKEYDINGTYLHRDTQSYTEELASQ
eukprot:4940135-Ditylum_brightwellii.AAC.1